MSRDDIATAERLRQAESSVEPALERWRNLLEMFFAQADRLADEGFLYRKGEGGWQAISWRAAAATVVSIATALKAEGLKPGDRVMLVSENRPEFALWDLGIMAAGGISVPTYITNTARDHQHILENSGARMVVVSTAKLARTVLSAAMSAPELKTLIGIEDLGIAQAGDKLAVRDASTLLQAHQGDAATIRRQVAGMRRRDIACLIYTSGTGGTPRGVMQHHGAILHNVAGCAEIIKADFPDTGRETFLSFLPPSHAYEHTAGQFLPIALGARLYYAESLEKLAANIEEVSPSIMVVVPRLFEVLRARMLKGIEKEGGMATRMLAHAERLERKRLTGRRIGLFDRPVAFLVERTIKKKVAARMGGRLKAMVSGGAPLNPEVGLFFSSVGVTLLQGYGQTEAGPVVSCNRPAAGIKMHTVGPPLYETEVMIADDGEILVAGELVMHGYWRNPEETAKALVDGWLHTGDIGIIDEDGHIVITDRKKDIIVNDKGENVAPQRIEGMLTLQPEISQAMVYGDRRPYLVGVVVPNAEYMMEWAAANGADVARLSGMPEFVRSVQAAVDRVNQQVQTLEKVRRVILADAPFTVENEQMTPSLKIRRHILKLIYAERLEALYR